MFLRCINCLEMPDKGRIAVDGKELKVKEGRTMVVVTHEMGFAREVSSQVLFLHESRVEERGHSDVLFNQPQSDRCRAFLASIL